MAESEKSTRAAPRRRVVVAMATGLESHPTARLPSAWAAASVVPEPQNGSSTSASSRLEARTIRSRSASGFCVGYPVSLRSRC